MRLRTKLALVLVVVVASVLVAHAGPRSDVAITLDANAALKAAAADLGGSAILLETSLGRVTLRGSVPTEKERGRAAKVVGDVAGVAEVENLLEVGVPETPAGARPSAAPLVAERSPGGSGIPVQAADDPDLRPVVSQNPLLDALGVRPRSTIDLGSPTIGTDDDEIRRSVQRALDDLDRRANADVLVTVRDGVVVLGGSVRTWQGNDQRLRATRSVPGVRTIVNDVRVVPEYR